MARIPEFTQQVFLDRANPGNIEASQAAFGGNKARGLLNEAQQIKESGRRVGQLGQEIQQQRDVQGQVKAHEAFNEYQRKKITVLNDQKNQRMAKPDGFTKDFDAWIQTEQGEFEDSLTTKEDDEPFDLAYYRQLVDRDRTSTKEENSNWENGMRVQNIAVGTEKGIDEMNVNFSLQTPRLRDLPKQLDEIKGYVNRVGAGVFDPQQNHKLFGYGADQATTTVMNSMLDQDPRALKDVIYYGAGTKDQLIERTMFDIEGGDKLVNEPDGTISKFGIKAGSNGVTEADVRGMTAEKASEWYASHWDPRLDKMTPAFRAVAWDAIVNHGNDKDTWSMIQKSKGDPYSLIALRQAKYAGLIQSDPAKYAQYQSGWENRMGQMSAYVQSQEGGGQAFLQHASLLDPEILGRTRAAIPGAIDAKDREAKSIQAQKVTEFNASFKDAYDVMTKDLEPLGPAEINDVKQLAINSGDAESIANAQALENMQPYVNQLKGLGEDQLRKLVRQRSADVNKNPSADTRLALEITQSVLDNQVKAVKEEGLAYYGRTNQIRMPLPVNYADPRASGTELRTREMSALNMYQRTGELLPVLTPDEISDLKEKFETLPSNEVAGAISTFDTLDQITKNKLAEAVDEKSHVLATAISVDNLDTRRRLLQGAKIEPKYEKADMQAQIDAVLDPMVVDPEFKAGAREAVMAWYNTVSAEKRDFSESVTPGRINDAIEAIYGPMVDLAFVGTERVFSFKDMNTGDFVPEDDLYDMFNGMTDTQLQKILGKTPSGAMGEPVTVKDIRESGRLISAGDGKYNISFDSTGGLIDAETGQLYEIDGRKLLDLWRKDGKKSADKFGTNRLVP